MTSHRFVPLGLAALLIAGCEKNPTDPRLSALSPDRVSASPSVATADGGCNDLPTAPESLRVDRYEPSFTSPTEVTNPLFPIARLDRVILLGKSEGVPLRVETTLLPRTETFRLGGRKFEALASQYVAWLDGRIHEVAIDWYVQDDLGAVWYLGEDVFNYEEGRIADTEGTWRAGREGPAAMIMPAHPEVGDVWRPENACGLVFEEVVATATGLTVDGPSGPVSGALVVRELHMDGTLEDKIFAPGYGEFSTGSGDDLEAVALAVPVDAVSGPMPTELITLFEGGKRVEEAARAEEWESAGSHRAQMTAAWAAFQAGSLPPRLAAQMEEALAALTAAVHARSAAEARQAAIQVARAALDFQLRHGPRAEIDQLHLELWELQLALDAEARDRAAVRGDQASIRWIRDRFSHQPHAGTLAGSIPVGGR